MSSSTTFPQPICSVRDRPGASGHRGWTARWSGLLEGFDADARRFQAHATPYKLYD